MVVVMDLITSSEDLRGGRRVRPGRLVKRDNVSLTLERYYLYSDLELG